jgi:hypothetical protein
MGEDGTVIEINSQSSFGTSPETTPDKSKVEPESKDDIDFEDNLGYLVFSG